MNFLDKQLGKFIQPPKHQIEIEAEKRDKKFYMRLRRLCQKHELPDYLDN